MKKPKIVFLCHFSNPEIRERLSLKEYKLINQWLKLRRKAPIKYDDFAIWVSDYAIEFEKHSEFEFHIVSPHKGMKQQRQDFVIRGVYYHFFKCDGLYFADFVKSRYHLHERNDYRDNRLIINEIMREINPSLLLLCGAENPYYSTAVLDVNSIPVYVILQTFLNDPKRIAMGVGSSYRRIVETKIFSHAQYFCTSSEIVIKTIKLINKNAIILPTGFPTHRPDIVVPKEKQYDYVFFARSITKNKGIEDILEAVAIVKKEVDKVSLNIIGGCDPDYKIKLDDLISRLHVNDNVSFSGYYDNIDDTFTNVAKASVIVLPGITAGLNSTVREAMFLGIPTICYETAATQEINRDKTCILTVPINDIDGLAKQMLWTMNDPLNAQRIADNGKAYAEHIFSNDAIVNKLLFNCQRIIEREV